MWFSDAIPQLLVARPQPEGWGIDRDPHTHPSLQDYDRAVQRYAAERLWHAKTHYLLSIVG
jgi:hypothetical protein